MSKPYAVSGKPMAKAWTTISVEQSGPIRHPRPLEIRTILHRPPTPDELRAAEADFALILNMYGVKSATDVGIDLDVYNDTSWLAGRGLWPSDCMSVEVWADDEYRIDWDVFAPARVEQIRKSCNDAEDNFKRMLRTLLRTEGCEDPTP